MGDTGMALTPKELVEALYSEVAREILRVASREPVSAEDIEEATGVSLATVYRHTEELSELDLLEEATEITEDGDHYSTFETKMRSVTLTVDRGEFHLDVRLRDDVFDRFGGCGGRWGATRRRGPAPDSRERSMAQSPEVWAFVLSNLVTFLLSATLTVVASARTGASGRRRSSSQPPAFSPSRPARSSRRCTSSGSTTGTSPRS